MHCQCRYSQASSPTLEWRIEKHIKEYLNWSPLWKRAVYVSLSLFQQLWLHIPQFLWHQLVFLAKHHRWARDPPPWPGAYLILPTPRGTWHNIKYHVSGRKGRATCNLCPTLLFLAVTSRVKGENFPRALDKSLWKCGFRSVNPLGQAHAEIYRTNNILNGGSREWCHNTWVLLSAKSQYDNLKRFTCTKAQTVNS